MSDTVTQTLGIAEELWEVRHKYPNLGTPTYHRPTPGINTAGKALYNLFQDLLVNIKAEEDHIAELGLIIL